MLEQSTRESNTLSNFKLGLRGPLVDWDRYRKIAAEAAAVFPEGERRNLIATLDAESKLWSRVLEWNDMLHATNDDYLLVRNVKAAEKRLAILQKWSSDAEGLLGKPGSPIAPELVVDYLSNLQATANRNTAMTELRDLFTRDDIKDVYVIRTKNNEAYFTREDPAKAVEQGRKLSISIDHLPLNSTVRKRIKHTEYAEHGKSPHSQMAELILTQVLPNIDKVGFDKTITDILAAHLQRQNDVDPILRIILLQSVMQIAAKGDSCLAAELTKPLQLIDDARNGGVDLSVPWWDPLRADANRVRASSKLFLGNFPGLAVIAAETQARREKLNKQLHASRCDVAGYLYEDPESGWTVGLLEPLSGRRALRMIDIKSGEPGGWAVIGELNNGKLSLNGQHRASFIDGRAVFASPE